MKLGILGDLHITNKGPDRRLDSFIDTQFDKLDQAWAIFERYGCDCVIQPGDFCDAPTIANRVIAKLIEFLNKRSLKVYCTWGQHDVSGHSSYTLPNSPLSVLEAAGVVKIVGSEGEKIGTVGEEKDEDVILYGSGFGEDIPEPCEDSYNILVAHKMVGSRPLWPGQELVAPKQFLKTHPNFNICVLGDYHYRFFEKWQGRVAVNMGCLVRKTICEFDLQLKPTVGVFDTATNDLQIYELKVQPVEQVFDLTRDVEKKDNTILRELVERIKMQGKRLPGWKNILIRVLGERRSGKGVREEIDLVLEEVKVSVDSKGI